MLIRRTAKKSMAQRFKELCNIDIGKATEFTFIIDDLLNHGDCTYIECATAFYYKSGSSDKVYYLILYKTELGTYSVRSYYGRNNGSKKTKHVYAAGRSIGNANSIFNKVAREKRDKGYYTLTGLCSFLNAALFKSSTDDAFIDAISKIR